MNPIQAEKLKDELARAEQEAAAVAERIAGLKTRLREADGWCCIGVVRFLEGRGIGFDYADAHGVLREATGRCINDGTNEYPFDLVWVNEFATRQTLTVFLTSDHKIQVGTKFWVKS